ncbi:hypothetical protein BDZ85DRAFT_176515, partial [Elsinoe ampelina]
LLSERIHPLPTPLREALISTFCPSPLQPLISSSPRDRDCLLRIYLGKRDFSSTSTSFTLRNFGLRLERIEKLGLQDEAVKWAGGMGEALAACHFAAEHEAGDVEFVLGSGISPSGPTSSGNSGGTESQGEMALWLLDFNCSLPLPLTVGGMQEAARVHWLNDPYYPRPGPWRENQLEKKLWDAFEESYLVTGGRIL